MKVLVTGGAGYKGCVVVKTLLDSGCEVTVLDNFMYGNYLIEHTRNEGFSAVRKDIRNIDKEDVKGADVVIHLAGLSGYTACEDNPHSAEMINQHACRKLVKLLGKEQRLIYAGTTSIYGRSGQKITEQDMPTPISIYGQTKLAGERICLEHPNAISLRFATIFGCAPRMRCDLMLNNFVWHAVNDKALVLFDADSQRTFIHISDVAEAYVKYSYSLSTGIYNIGDNRLNYTKRQVAEMIQAKVDYDIIYSDMEDFDKRHYVVDYSKAKAEGFECCYTVEDGIDELLKLYAFYQPFRHHATI